VQASSLGQWYSTFFVRVPPDIISLQLWPSKLLVHNASYTYCIIYVPLTCLRVPPVEYHCSRGLASVLVVEWPKQTAVSARTTRGITAWYFSVEWWSASVRTVAVVKL
jgi:hypothetical protein